MRMRRWLIVLGILVFVFAVLMPIGLGFGIEKQYLVSLDGFAGAGSPVRITSHFDRGLWVSRAVTQIELEGRDTPLIVRVDQTFVHGPVPWAEMLWERSPLTWAVAVVDSQIQILPAPPQNLETETEEGATPFRAHLLAWIRFDRAVDGLWRSPDWMASDGSVRVSPLLGHFRLESDEFGPSGGFLRLNGLRLGGPGQSFAVDSLNLRHGLDPGPENALTTSWDFENLEVAGSRGFLKVAGARGRHRQSAEGRAGSASRLDSSWSAVAWFASPEDNEPTFQLEGLKWVQIWPSQDDSGLRSWQTKASIDLLVLPGVDWGPGSVSMVGHHFDLQPFLSLLAPGATGVDGSEPNVQGAVSHFLSRSPEWMLESLVLDSPAGSLTGEGRIQIDGSDPSLLSDSMMRWMLVEAEFEWRLPQGAVEQLVDAYLIQSVRDEMPGVSDSELAEMAAFLRGDLIDSALDQGWLKTGTDGYEIDFRLEQGLPEVNGQMVDPTRLLGGLGSSS